MSLFGPNEITCVDVGTGGIKAVCIKPGGRPRLTAATLVDFSPEGGPAQAASGLRTLLSGKKIGRKNVFTVMPSRAITIRPLSLPKMPLPELREAVRWEAKRHISYALEEAFVEYIITGERQEGAVDKYDLVLVAAEQSKIRDHLRPFEEAGMSVAVVDANALVLRNSLFLQNRTAPSEILAIDIGAGNMEINIFKDGTLRFSRCLETGGNDITRLVAEHLNISMEAAEAAKRDLRIVPASPDTTIATVTSRLDALLMEIRRSAEYYRTTCREKGVEYAVLSGGAVLMNGLPEYFSAALGLRVELWNPFEPLERNAAIDRELGAAAPRFSAAVGLALRNA
ncbi:MAG TPA: type IV pilus assembly protein PilM [Nitrospirota bacterium]|nr:type IV pilus assembly protein PilM [Nitrospirota bacterium]